jgi:vesicle transport through interaction with t-SNAREs protein 1
MLGGGDMFATYSGEFEDYRTQISHAIEDFVIADAAKRATLSRKILQDIDELGDIIKQMELEVRSHQGPARQTLNERLVGFRKSRQEVQKAWRVAKDVADDGTRDSLLSGSRGAAGAEAGGAYAATNARENEMDSLLSKTTDRLNETRRTLAETERVGTLIFQTTRALKSSFSMYVYVCVCAC